MRFGARGGKPPGRPDIPKPRTGHPSLGRGQPRASRTGRQRRARLPSTPRRGGGNAEFGCRDGRRRQGAGAVCTGTPSDCGSRREGFQPGVSLPAIGFRSRVRIASRIPVRAGGTGSVLDTISATSWLLLLPGLGDPRLGSRSTDAHREKDQSRGHGGGRPSPPTPGEPCAGTVAARPRFTGRDTGPSLRAQVPS